MNRVLTILVLLAVAHSATAPGAPHESLGDPAAALVLIDIQDFYFPGGALPLVEPEAAASNAGRVLAAFRERGRMIVHVGHQVRAGGDFHTAVAPLPGEIVVMKSEVNAFQDTELLGLLRDAGIERLVLCGMQTHMCLEGAARAAADHGFACVVVADACATRDLERDGSVVAAEDVHRATLATLDGAYAEVVDTAALLGAE